MHDFQCLDLVYAAFDNHFRIICLVHQEVQAVDETLRDIAFRHDVGILSAIDVQRHFVAGARFAPEADFARGVAADA